jgi:HD-GYP domain-containing protein (c-di-GMP phosphodiesterase class II)
VPVFTSHTQISPPSTAAGLLAAMEDRDLVGHGSRVATLCATVCIRLRLTARPIELIATAGLMHDVGKLAVPAAILDHPGHLSDGAWELVRDHPVAGERALKMIPGLEGTAALVRHSHERWDGGGYPDGLEGALIPLGARIIAVCDAWDAMTNDRVYRPALPRDEAIDALVAGAGAQFDPDVVAALIACVNNVR